MANRNKRERRKRETARRVKARNDERRSPMYIGNFKEFSKQALVDHSSLLDVVTLPQGSVERGLREEERLRYLGYSDFTYVRWDSDSAEQYYSNDVHRDGGLVDTIRESKGKLRTILFIYTNPGKKDVRAGIDIAMLHHELGHVDDIEKGINLREGQPVDLVRAELHAHKYACTLMMKRNLRFSLAFYLTDAIPQLQRSDAALVRAAADAFVQSEVCARVRDWNAAILEHFE